MSDATVDGGDAPIPVIPVAQLEGPASPAEELAPQAAETADPLMSRDEFFALFRGAHAATAVGLPMAGGPQLRTLAHVETIGGAREASDALYDIIVELPWMHWLLQKSGKWMQRVSVIAMYGVNLAAAVQAELAAQAPRPVRSPADSAVL